MGDGGKEQLPFIRSCSGGVCVCVQGPCVGQGREKERMALDQQLCVSRPAGVPGGPGGANTAQHMLLIGVPRRHHRPPTPCEPRSAAP